MVAGNQEVQPCGCNPERAQASQERSRLVVPRGSVAALMDLPKSLALFLDGGRGSESSCSTRAKGARQCGPALRQNGSGFHFVSF
jgi:hypothetical protein